MQPLKLSYNFLNNLFYISLIFPLIFVRSIFFIFPLIFVGSIFDDSLTIFLVLVLWAGPARNANDWRESRPADAGPDIANEVTDLCHSQTPPQFLIHLCVHSAKIYILMPIHKNNFASTSGEIYTSLYWRKMFPFKILHSFGQKWKAHFCSSNEFWNLSYQPPIFQICNLPQHQNLQIHGGQLSLELPVKQGALSSMPDKSKPLLSFL